MKKTSALAIIFTIIVLSCCIGFVSCDKHDDPIQVNYALDNDFNVGVTDTQTRMTFEPLSADGIRVDYKYGLVFYPGTLIDAKYYEYLGNALAKQGYLVVIPKLLFAYAQYENEESAFADYPNVRFFVGGHSQGGGAAIRRAQECYDQITGAILFSPLAYRHQLLDENGDPVKDENEIEIYIKDTLIDLSLPALLLEASDDNVLSDEQKADAKSRLNENCTMSYAITPGSHMSFSTMDTDEILSMFNNDGNGMTQQEKDEQRNLAVIYTLAFMQSVVLG